MEWRSNVEVCGDWSKQLTEGLQLLDALSTLPDESVVRKQPVSVRESIDGSVILELTALQEPALVVTYNSPTSTAHKQKASENTSDKAAQSI